MKYRTRQIEVDAVTWTGENLDEVSEFLGSAYAGVRRDERRVQMLLLATPDNPATPIAVRPGWKVVCLEGEVRAWSPETFAAMFEPVA
jgi:hypothetical protein